MAATVDYKYEKGDFDGFIIFRLDTTFDPPEWVEIGEWLPSEGEARRVVKLLKEKSDDK
jgi:hypothetical protein